MLFAVDLTPVDYKQYFNELFAGISFKGLIVHWVYSPVVCLLKEGSEMCRDSPPVVGRIWLPSRLRIKHNEHSVTK